MIKKPTLFVITIFSFCFADARQKNSAADTLPKVVIINSFDVSSLQVRKNKRDLFKELTDSLQVYLSENLRAQLSLESIITPGLTKTDDSTILFLMHSKQARNAIVTRSVEVYFNEGGEKHTNEYGSSPKIETSYDLCSKVDYEFYGLDSVLQQKQINLCDYFTTRSVNDKSFVIKFGPDIVGKKKHTYGAIEKNAARYVGLLSHYFETPANQ